MITMEAALDKFINERVLGDRGFGFDEKTRRCIYNHENNGGCEIGQYLTDEEINRYCSKNGAIADIFAAYPHIKDKFEITNDNRHRSFNFWQQLQYSHDALASYYFHIDLKDYWQNFERSLYYLVTILESIKNEV